MSIMNEITITDKKLAAMDRAGATRERAYQAMVEGLSAVNITVDKYGEEHESPDTSNRLKSAEMIARLHGDLRTDVVVESKTTNLVVTGTASELSELILLVQGVKEDLKARVGSGGQTGEIIDVTPNN